MITKVPDANQLSKLPLRAIVAYALRAAQRVMIGQHVGYIETCETALLVAHDFVQSSSVTRDAARQAAHAAAAVAEAEALNESGRNLRVGLSVRAAATSCYYAVSALVNTDAEPKSCLQKAAAEAVRTARQMDETDNELAVADYELLVQLFGNQDSIVLGNSFDPSEKGPLGSVSRGRQ